MSLFLTHGPQCQPRNRTRARAQTFDGSAEVRLTGGIPVPGPTDADNDGFYGFSQLLGGLVSERLHSLKVRAGSVDLEVSAEGGVFGNPGFFYTVPAGAEEWLLLPDSDQVYTADQFLFRSVGLAVSAPEHQVWFTVLERTDLD